LCLHLGFVANLIAMICTAYSCLSISLDYFLLSKSSMEVVTATDVNGKLPNHVHLFLGLRGVAFDGDDVGEGFAFDYDDLCEFAAGSGNIFVDAEKDCESCSSGYFSMNAVISLMIAVTLFFPTFFSQQLRMYSGYDVNCVKNFLTLIGFCIVLLNLNVMLAYFYLCSKESFYETPQMAFDGKGNVVSVNDAFYLIEYEWKYGWGLYALMAGTGFKVLDLLCNIAIPTPTVTRVQREQEVYETLVYIDPEDAVNASRNVSGSTSSNEDNNSTTNSNYMRGGANGDENFVDEDEVDEDEVDDDEVDDDEVDDEDEDQDVVDNDEELEEEEVEYNDEDGGESADGESYDESYDEVDELVDEESDESAGEEEVEYDEPYQQPTK